MTCEEWRRRLEAGDDLDLSPAEQKALATHLASCPSCRAAWEAQKHAVQRLREFYRSFDPQPGQVFQFTYPSDPASPKNLWEWVVALLPRSSFSLAVIGGLALLFLVVLFPSRMHAPQKYRKNFGWIAVSGKMVARHGKDSPRPGKPLLRSTLYEVRSLTELSADEAITVLLQPESLFQFDTGSVTLEGTARFTVATTTNRWPIEFPGGQIILQGSSAHPEVSANIHISQREVVVEPLIGSVLIDLPSLSLTVTASQTAIWRPNHDPLIATFSPPLFDANGEFQGVPPRFPNRSSSTQSETPSDPPAPGQGTNSATPPAATFPGTQPHDDPSSVPPIASPTAVATATVEPGSEPSLTNPVDFLRQ